MYFSYNPDGTLNESAGTTHTWDYKNRLTSTTRAGVTTSYTYDAAMERTSKATSTTTTYYPSGNYSIAGSTTTIHIGNIATVDITGTTTTVSTNHTDHLGSTAVVTNSSGTLTELLDYYPYGVERLHMGSSDEQRTYIGEYSDDETSYSYLNARYYNPGTGMFLSEDPVFLGMGLKFYNVALLNPQSINSYAYAGGNPIVNNDTSGCFWWKEFYTQWDGYAGVSGLAMKAGEVLGGRFAAQDAINKNASNIDNSSQETGVNVNTYKAIAYEENAHQMPPGGLERAIENIIPTAVSGGIGVMQVSSGTSGLSNSELLNDAKNVDAAGGILQNIQNHYGSDVATIGSVYNSGGLNNNHGQEYGQRISSYANSSLAPTVLDGVVRSIASSVTQVVTNSIFGPLGSLFSSKK